MISKLLVVSLLASSVATGESCTCRPRDLRQIYCTSDFVAVVEIVDRKDCLEKFYFGPYHCSEFRAKTVFKTPNGNVTTAVASKDPEDCGVVFTPRQEYLVFGNLREYQGKKRIRVYSCDTPRLWTGLESMAREDILNALNPNETCSQLS